MTMREIHPEEVPAVRLTRCERCGLALTRLRDGRNVCF